MRGHLRRWLAPASLLVRGSHRWAEPLKSSTADSEETLDLTVEGTIVFETRAHISYNLKFVYGRGRLIGWLAQTIKASWGIASFWG
jgi:hypothetical protein